MLFGRLQSTLRLGQVRLAVAALVTGLTLTTIATPTSAVVRIRDDRGGNIGAYWSRFSALRDMGEKIIIDGTCSSACTLVLGIVPHDRICVTQRALLGFHAAWRSDFLGSKIVNEPATRTLMSFYPAPIRRWIDDHGGLGTGMLYLSGRELIDMYRECH
jgi:hypothetical protein